LLIRLTRTNKNDVNNWEQIFLANKKAYRTNNNIQRTKY
jgi:hypothetical protein